MPIGYALSMLFAALATMLALAPRATRGPRATPAFVLGSVANEIPFLILYWLVASTLLAVIQGDIDSPLGWFGLGAALLTAVGLAVVVRLAAKARPALEAALAAGLGHDWRGALDPRMAQQLGRHAPLRRILIAPVQIPSRVVRRTRNIAYGPAGRENLLDVYRHRANPSHSPTLIYFHPGGFFRGRKSREARPLFERLARHGWVCMSANYRLGRAGSFPAHLIDAKLVVAWVRRHADDYGADPDLLFVAGGSAGAHLAAMCALTANDPAFQPGFEDAVTSVTAAVALYGYYGSAPGRGPIPSAPGDHLSAGAPPFLVIHGARDPMISAEDARRFVDQVRTASSNPVVYAELPGGQHNFDRFPSIRFAAVIDGIEAFTAWVRSSRSDPRLTS